jgi:opacity protein-like surface antigen
MIRRLTAVLLTAAMAAPAHATDVLSSSYVDASYLSSERETDPATSTAEMEGFRLGANIGLASFLNFTGDYEQRRFHNDRIGTGSAGLAYHTDNPVYRFHFGASYERVEFDDNANPAADAIEEGFGAELGARYAFPHVEVHAAYKYLDFGTLDGTDTDFTGARYGAGADIQLTNWWSLALDYRMREHETQAPGASSQTAEYSEWTAGFRRYFATDADRRQRHGGLLSAWFSDDEGAE